jgi:hypothetical protein
LKSSSYPPSTTEEEVKIFPVVDEANRCDDVSFALFGALEELGGFVGVDFTSTSSFPEDALASFFTGEFDAESDGCLLSFGA